MARAATSRKRNIPGFGWLTKKKVTHSSSASTKAFKAGQKSGDTGEFSSWIGRQRLGDISSSFRRQLEERFRAGVERGESRSTHRTEKAGRRVDALAERRERLAEKKLRAQESTADRRERLAEKKLRAQELAAEAKVKAAEKKIATAEHKIAVAEKKLDKGGMAEAQFEAMKARMEREIQAQEEHKRAAQSKLNPNRRSARYRMARGEESRPTERNCQSSTEYRLGYNLGQMDRQTAQLRKSLGELHAAFAAQFPHSPNWESFESAYQSGYGGNAVPGRRNPETRDEEYEQAKKTAELFHGRPVQEEIEVEEKIKTHDWYVSIGPLVKLVIKPLSKSPRKTVSLPFPKAGEDVVQLFCSPDGRQFYLRGGDQELNLEALGMGEGTDWFRDFMLIGEAKEITYRDKKKFHKFALTEYFHKLGEVTGKKPMFAYDSLAHKMSIVGGQYKVEMDDLVDGMSPGIVN